MWLYFKLLNIFFIFFSSILWCFHCHLNIGSRNKDIVFTKYLVWSELFCRCLSFFSLKCFYWERFMYVFTEYQFVGENLSSLYNTKCKMNISYWPLYSIRDKETRTKLLLWERDRLNFGCWLGRQWILSWGSYSQTSVGWGDIESFLLDEMFKHIFFPSRFSLNLNWLVKICPSFRIQSVHWTYQIGLSIQQETKKKGQNYCYEKRKGFTLALGWEASKLFPEGLILQLILAGKTFNSFLLDGFFFNVTKYINWIR